MPSAPTSLADLRARAIGRGIHNAHTLSPEALRLALGLTTQPWESPQPETLSSSSGQHPKSPASHQAAPLPDNAGPALPDHYDEDILVLLAQDPRHVFAYWEVTPQRLATVSEMAGPGSMAVLLLDGPGGRDQRCVDLAGGNYYVVVQPGERYHASLALRSPTGHLFYLVSGASAVTPQAGPSWRTDATWVAVEEVWNPAQGTLPGHTFIGSSWGLRTHELEEIPDEHLGSGEFVNQESALLSGQTLGSSGHLGSSSQHQSGRTVGSSGGSHTVGSSRLPGSLTSGGGLFNHDSTSYPVDGLLISEPTGLPVTLTEPPAMSAPTPQPILGSPLSIENSAPLTNPPTAPLSRRARRLRRR